MKKYKTYIITFLSLLTICISICFIPIDATRFIPTVEKQFEQDLGLKVHIEKLIFRFGPSLKIKAPIMHVMYQDGQKFGQIDNVKFYVPWSTLFKNDIYVKRIYADRFIVKVASSDKYLSDLLNKLNDKEYDMYPNLQLKDYSILYTYKESNHQYLIKGSNLELTKLNLHKNLKLNTDGCFYINDKPYINYTISFVPDIELNKNAKSNFNIKEFVEQVENMDFHSDVIANLKLYENSSKGLQISGIVNLDNISVLDAGKNNPKSFIYLTFLGNKISILSNIYASSDKKIYIQGDINNSKKPDIDLKVKTDEIMISDIYKKIKLLIDCSKYKGIDDIDGKMLADFNIKGDLNKIKSSGYMKISNATIKAGNLNIQNISSDIDFSNNLVSISNAIGYVNSAPIILKGKINNNIDLELLMDRVELKHLLPDTFGIQKGIISLDAQFSGTLENIIHKANVQITNFLAKKDENALSFDSLKVDTNKENIAYISNVIIKPKSTENIKLPLLKLIIDDEKIKIPDTNIFMPNSKIKAKAEITDYNTNKFLFSSVFDGYINSKDLSGFSKTSTIYPVKFNISGTKNIQNVDGQIHLIKAMYFDEPSLINISAKFEDNSVKIDDLSLSAFNGKLSDNFKSNMKGNKKIIITGSIEELKKPVFKNLRIFIPQQINLNINDILLQLKGDLFVNGGVKTPEIIGQISAQNIIVQFMQLMVNNLSIDFNKDLAVINAPVIKLADSSAGLNAVLSTNLADGLLFKSVNIKSKFLNLDTFLMYEDKFFSSLPLNVNSGKLYAERAAISLYNSPLYVSALNSDFSIKNNKIDISNLAAEIYNGKLAGDITYNLVEESFKSNIQARGVSATPIFDVIAINKDTVSGTMDFDTTLSGNLSTKQSLNGNIKFVVHNGHMGTLGKLEHLLYAQNVIADNMMRTSLSVVTKAITLKDTGLFKYLRGDINMKDGIANINMMQSQGPLMSLFIKGQYNPSNDYAKLVVLGRLSDEIVSGLGVFGEFSFNKLMIMLTGDDNRANIKVEDIDKLPQLPMKNTKEFRTIINGILEKPSSVILFNWISYSQKSLRQPDVPSSNEKVPEFIESLPY